MSRAALALVAVAALSCEGAAEPPASRATVFPPRAVARPDLRWKRARVVERDLARALELTEAELCLEFGRRRCLRAENAQRADQWAEPDLGAANAFFDLVSPGGVHLVALGGNDPFFRNQHRPVDRPLVTTPVALDRLVLAACGKRATRDAAPGATARVFTGVDLGAARVPSDSPAVATLATTMYRRLLARDPKPAELAALRASITEGDEAPPSAHDLAVMVCYAVATSTEFVFQ